MTSHTPPLILASASPRRKEILEAHGHVFTVIPSDVDETIPGGVPLTPEEIAIYLAELKAEAVFAGLRPEDYPEGCTILAVDTIVYKDRIFGKPVDEEDSLNILRALKNTTHTVISGVCLIMCRGGILPPAEKFLLSDATRVTFGDYTDNDILTYIRANPPYDKSGSYAVQSDWGRHIKNVDGDLENVIGLPYHKIAPYI